MIMRLDKLLGHSGFGTRKEVKQYIRKGYVTVNSIIVKKDDVKVDTDVDVVCFDGENVNYKQFVYLMLNKPAGYISATKDNVHPTVLELIVGYENYDLFPVGRLDIDTEGFIIISNDGDFSHKLLSPSNNHDKCYFATIDGVITDEDIKLFYDGITIDTGYKCKSAILKVRSVENDVSNVEVIITEGKFHQVKKMFNAINKPLTFLKRVSIKGVMLDQELELGEFRELNSGEYIDLFKDL